LSGGGSVPVDRASPKQWVDMVESMQSMATTMFTKQPFSLIMLALELPGKFTYDLSQDRRQL